MPCTLHFRIRLDEETGFLDGRLCREIESRWPLKKPQVSTLDLAHDQEGFRIEIVGWPGCRDSILRFLLECCREERRARYPWADAHQQEALFACVERRATPLPEFAQWAVRSGLLSEEEIR